MRKVAGRATEKEQKIFNASILIGHLVTNRNDIVRLEVTDKLADRLQRIEAYLQLSPCLGAGRGENTLRVVIESISGNERQAVFTVCDFDVKGELSRNESRFVRDSRKKVPVWTPKMARTIFQSIVKYMRTDVDLVMRWGVRFHPKQDMDPNFNGLGGYVIVE